jgi:hypothetical protein
MLPDFPTLKKKYESITQNYINATQEQDPILSKVGKVHHFEGDRFSSNPQVVGKDESTYKEISFEFSIKREEIIDKGFNAFIEYIRDMGENFKENQAREMFSKIDEATRNTGNTIDAKGTPFCYEQILEALDKMWIEFDDNGSPYMPTLYVGPELNEIIKEKIPEWDKDPQANLKLETIINKKRNEWHDRESNRKLVD